MIRSGYSDSYPECSCESTGDYLKNTDPDQTDLIRISVVELQASAVVQNFANDSNVQAKVEKQIMYR